MGTVQFLLSYVQIMSSAALYIPYSLAKYKGLTLQRYPVLRVHPGSPIAGLRPGTDSDSPTLLHTDLSHMHGPFRDRD